MSEYRYILQPYKGQASRYKCPDCGKAKAFARYIDLTNNEELNDGVGRCNRETGCGYHYTPKQYFTDNQIYQDKSTYTLPQPRPIQPIHFIDNIVFKKCLGGSRSNYLTKFLLTLFDSNTVEMLIQKYHIATSSHWPGATVFWYVDTLDRVNYGKIMVYDPATGKREHGKNTQCATVLINAHKKAGTTAPDWLIKYESNESKINCFFGEHLLKEAPNMPVAIVESEKTAIICSVYFPQYIWLAAGALSYLSERKCVPLSGRSVRLFPDLGSAGKDGEMCLDDISGAIHQKKDGVWISTGKKLSAENIIKHKHKFKYIGLHRTRTAYQKWREKAEQFGFEVSDLLEEKATPVERQSGLDLADYLIRFNVKEFLSLADNKFNARPLLHQVHAKYTAAEAEGKLNDRPDADHINMLWRGAQLARKRPEIQALYLEQLNEIEL